MANLQKGVLTKVLEFLNNKKYNYEVIVVDDGSEDGSVIFLEKFVREHKHISLLKNPHIGKAGAVTTGMIHAKGKYILFTDMDQATPIEEIDTLLPYFEQKYDIVIGSRRGQRKGSPWTRLLMSRVWMMIRKLVIGLGIEDTQCGFKMFTFKAAHALCSRMQTIHHGFQRVTGSHVTAGFDVELLYLAQKMGYHIKEVPIKWLYVETRRVNVIKDSFEALLYLWHIRINQMTGVYN